MLFLCTYNSCRSQMAEGWLRALAGDRIEALSAGTDPSGVHPRVVEVMAEVGVDVSAQSSDALADYLDDPPELVIAVCTRASRSCATFPGHTPVACWPFDDPAQAEGSEDEVLAVFRRVRDEIRARIAAWLEQGAAPLSLER